MKNIDMTRFCIVVGNIGKRNGKQSVEKKIYNREVPYGEPRCEIKTLRVAYTRTRLVRSRRQQLEIDPSKWGLRVHPLLLFFPLYRQCRWCEKQRDIDLDGNVLSENAPAWKILRCVCALFTVQEFFSNSAQRPARPSLFALNNRLTYFNQAILLKIHSVLSQRQFRYFPLPSLV